MGKINPCSPVLIVQVLPRDGGDGHGERGDAERQVEMCPLPEPVIPESDESGSCVSLGTRGNADWNHGGKLNQDFWKAKSA